VYVNSVQEQRNLSGLRVTVSPHVNAIDHIYHFNERQAQAVTLMMPGVYSYTLPAFDKRPVIKATDRGVSVEWANDFEIRL
jgi:hypothetical protein